MKAMFANVIAEYIRPESKAVAIPILNVSELLASGFSFTIFDMKNLINQMQVTVSTIQRMVPVNVVAPADNFNVDKYCPANMQTVETAPNARPAVPAVFQMIFLFIFLDLIPLLMQR